MADLKRLATIEQPVDDPYNALNVDSVLTPINMDVETFRQYWKAGAAIEQDTFLARDDRLKSQAEWLQGTYATITRERFVVRDNLILALLEELVHSAMAVPPIITGTDRDDDEDFISDYHRATRQVLRSKFTHGAGVYNIPVDGMDEDDLEYTIESVPALYYKPMDNGYVIIEPYTDYTASDATTGEFNRCRVTIFEDFDGEVGTEEFSDWVLTGGNQLDSQISRIVFETPRRATLGAIGDNPGYFGHSMLERLLTGQLELNRLLSQRSAMQHIHADPHIVVQGPQSSIENRVADFKLSTGSSNARPSDMLAAQFQKPMITLPDGWDAKYLTWDQNITGINESIKDQRRMMREQAGLQSTTAEPPAGTMSATGIELLQNSSYQTSQTLIRETRLQLLDVARQYVLITGGDPDAVTVEWLNAFDVTSAETDNVDITEEQEAQEDEGSSETN